MRIDAISIFPQFFDVLDISLLGKAKAQDLLEVKIHDLRDFTDDKHRTVDDTPFGGGAGMLMKAEPWGQRDFSFSCGRAFQAGNSTGAFQS
jgi:tRNA (guanine37-N1)-methyltransferase